MGPLRAKVVNGEGGDPAVARVSAAAGPIHRCTLAWPHLRRGALPQTTWDSWVSPQRASGETEAAEQACSTEQLKPRATQPTMDSQGSDISVPASVSSPRVPAGTGRGHLHRRPGVWGPRPQLLPPLSTPHGSQGQCLLNKAAPNYPLAPTAPALLGPCLVDVWAGWG